MQPELITRELDVITFRKKFHINCDITLLVSFRNSRWNAVRHIEYVITQDAQNCSCYLWATLSNYVMRKILGPIGWRQALAGKHEIEEYIMIGLQKINHARLYCAALLCQHWPNESHREGMPHLSVKITTTFRLSDLLLLIFLAAVFPDLGKRCNVRDTNINVIIHLANDSAFTCLLTSRKRYCSQLRMRSFTLSRTGLNFNFR